MAIEINGMAHVNVTASDFVAARAFYAELLPFLGLKAVIDTDDYYYCVGGRTAFGVQRCSPQHAGKRFDQGAVGLHHACFRARAREDVDRVHELVRRLGATIVHPPEDGPFAPGYYSLLFEDPSGIRLEINHVPGRGLLEAR
jgi:catechol 2,3-dioxygenase-like lactoylglutathione lyase family enzyme